VDKYRTKDGREVIIIHFAGYKQWLAIDDKCLYFYTEKEFYEKFEKVGE